MRVVLLTIFLGAAVAQAHPDDRLDPALNAASSVTLAPGAIELDLQSEIDEGVVVLSSGINLANVFGWSLRLSGFYAPAEDASPVGELRLDANLAYPVSDALQLSFAFEGAHSFQPDVFAALAWNF